MGLSPSSDRVHKCGQTQGTEAVSVCTDSVGYHSCHSAGTCPPPLPTLPLESAATRPPPLFPHNVSIVTCQVVAGRQGWHTPACWGKEDAGGIHSPSSASKALDFILSALAMSHPSGPLAWVHTGRILSPLFTIYLMRQNHRHD